MYTINWRINHSDAMALGVRLAIHVKEHLISQISLSIDIPHYVALFHDDGSFNVPVKGNVLHSHVGSEFGVSPELIMLGAFP